MRTRIGSHLRMAPSWVLLTVAACVLLGAFYASTKAFAPRTSNAADIQPPAAKASASPPRAVAAMSVTRKTRAGRYVRVTARLADKTTQSCQLGLVRHGRTYNRLSKTTIKTSKNRVTWKWRVPKRARALTWKAAVRCRVQTGEARVVTKRFRVTRGMKAGKVRAPAKSFRKRNYGSALRPKAAPPEQGSDPGANADQLFAQYRARRFPVQPTQGECTDWVDYKAIALDRAFFDFAMKTQRHASAAYEYDDYAREVGRVVDATPQPGDVAVWERGAAGASAAFGHVAFVTSVDANGVRVSEMNANGTRAMTEGYLSAERLAAASFIHAQ